jgi:hypothetical protein
VSVEASILQRAAKLSQINLRKENPVARPDSNRDHHTGQARAAEAAIAALGFLAEDPERLERFLALSGLGPHNLREAARQPSFLAAVLDYVTGDEKLLIAFASREGQRPEAIVRARDALAGPPPDDP